MIEAATIRQIPYTHIQKSLATRLLSSDCEAKVRQNIESFFKKMRVCHKSVTHPFFVCFCIF